MRFVKVDNDSSSDTEPSHLLNIEFVFDADAKCAIQIFYFCTEEATATGLTYALLYSLIRFF